MSRSREESPTTVLSGHGECDGLFVESTDACQQRSQAADEAPLTSDDADLLAEGATILERAKQSAQDRVARIALEEEYHRAYQPLRDEIYLMRGNRSNAHFHGQVYDVAVHLPRLAESLVHYFQVLQKPEHIHRLRSVDESTFLQQSKVNDNSRLALVCLRYTLRLFQAGVTGASKEQVKRKVGEVNENEQLAGVWAWIIRLGFELGPDNRPQVVVNGDGSLANKGSEPGATGQEGAGARASQTLASQSQQQPPQREANVQEGLAERPKQRPCFLRDRAWLEWYNDENAETYHRPAKIRGKWNSMSPEERKRISPDAFNKIGDNQNGLDIVKKAIKKARQEPASAEDT